MTLKIEPTRGSYFKITLDGETICECMTRSQSQEKFEFLAKVWESGFGHGWDAGNMEGYNEAMFQVHGE